jgi:hypothetical protein
VTDTAQVVTGLLALPLLASVLVIARTTARRCYSPAGYATFRQPAPGEQLLACEGQCPGLTPHEKDGDSTATCTICGAPRPESAEAGEG